MFKITVRCISLLNRWFTAANRVIKAVKTYLIRINSSCYWLWQHGSELHVPFLTRLFVSSSSQVFGKIFQNFPEARLLRAFLFCSFSLLNNARAIVNLHRILGKKVNTRTRQSISSERNSTLATKGDFCLIG